MKKHCTIILIAVSIIALTACTSTARFSNASDKDSGTIRGYASYYHDKFNGRKTANGEVFAQSKLTAAHRELPFGTIVRVTRVSNGKSVLVRINDRGPFVDGRIIDLSLAAAKELDMINDGVVEVVLQIQK
ncbi:MAG: septal ring lytic transglycosylase RlpA family protein [Ignavibacteria bacterium]|jgi:rare lipoprotein A|nr:septal ring lytic transglycosylase RlpA family protein [Ignavibacteria bacterium]